MSKTFDWEKADKAQDDYCDRENLPRFAPRQFCYKCHQDIWAKEGKTIPGGRVISGISIEEAGDNLITGCPFCSATYCD